MTQPAQGILTTAQPPAAGVYVQAVIYAQATFEASAQWAIHDLPKGSAHFHAHARYHVQPPQTVAFRVSARYEMSAGTHSIAEVTLPATARFGASVVPQASVTFAVNASFTGPPPTVSHAVAPKTNIVLPNPGRVVSPILPVLRQASQGGKTPQRRSTHDDPTRGAKTSIILPNPTSPVYPVLGALRQPHTGGHGPLTNNPVVPITTGAGAQVNSSPMTWTDTIPANADYAVLWVINRTSVASPTISATIGGASATLVSTLFNPASSGFFDNLLCYVLQRPPTGPSTISFSTTSLLGCGGTIEYYRNVTSIGSVITAAAANSSATMSTPTSPNFMYAQAFSFIANSVGQAFSAYNQTQRASQVTFNNIEPLVIGDAVGNGGAVTFSATCATTLGWVGVILPLL